MDLTPAVIARAEFPTARKGFDPAAVRTYLSQVSFTVGSLQQQLGEARAEAEAERARADAIEARAPELVAAAEEQARVRTESAEVEASTRLEEAERQATERLEAAEAEARKRLAAAEEQATVAVHEGGQRAQALVNEAQQQADEVRAASAAAAAASVAKASADARAGAEAERAALAGEVETLQSRVDQLKSHTASLEAHIDRLEAHIDHLELYLAGHRRRLATTAVSLARVLRDPDALAGLPDLDLPAPAVAVVAREPSVPATRSSIDRDLDEVDIAGELFGLVDPTPVTAHYDLPEERAERPTWEDDELAGSFFDQGPYADDRWLARKDRKGA
ncbi:MAG TPA: DivIVA domain-containing protein [Acidimicrobiales bacterium]